jgi:predicted Zn-dependent protease with MMP-like domain
LALDRLPEELQSLMGALIGEWKRQAVMDRFGYEVPW